MTRTTRSKPRKKRLSRDARKLVSKFIAQERRTGMPPRQAVAVAFSRSRAREAKMKLNELVKKYS